MTEFFDSIEIISVFWLFGIVLFFLAAGHIAFTIRKTATKGHLTWKTFHRDERGAAYSLSFVLIMPFLVLILGLILETSNLIIAKAGTMHAAFHSARAAAVWTTINQPNEAFKNLDDDSLVVRKAELAATIAMTPFAGGLQKDVSPDPEADVFLKAYKAYVALDRVQKPIKDKYILNKYSYAKRNIRVVLDFADDDTATESDPTSKPWMRGVRSTVQYDAPFLAPYIGRLLGGKKKNGKIVYEIRSTASIQNECPRNETGCLGIRAVPGR